MNEIIKFYEGSGTDHARRKLSDILAWDDDRLEKTHDYVQWLFPLSESSIYNHSAPILDPYTINIFRTSSALHHEFKRSIERMESFYRLDDVLPRWVTFRNHNYLRLTRIMKSSRILGHHDAADKILNKLNVIYSNHPERIGTQTFKYWSEAAE